MTDLFSELARNATFWSGIAAWIVAQAAKLLCSRAIPRRGDFRWLVSLGGMPSAHSATVGALTTAIGWHCGFNSPLFGLSIGIAVLIMFDASTVRRAAGQQARLLNEIIEEISRGKQFPDKKLIELLGHTRLEVILGFVVGVLVALLVNSFFPFPPARMN